MHLPIFNGLEYRAKMTQSKQPYEHIIHKSLAHHLLYDARHNSFRFSKVLKEFDFFLVRTIETHEHLSDWMIYS